MPCARMTRRSCSEHVCGQTPGRYLTRSGSTEGYANLALLAAAYRPVEIGQGMASKACLVASRSIANAVPAQ